MSSSSSPPENASLSRPPGQFRPRPVSSISQNAYYPPPSSHPREVTPRPIAQTGRSRTAPSLDAVTTSSRLEASGRPQLNERDSIFATHYVPASSPDSPPTSPAILGTALQTDYDHSEGREGSTQITMVAPSGRNRTNHTVLNEHLSPAYLSPSLDQQNTFRRISHHDNTKRHSATLQDILLGRARNHKLDGQPQTGFGLRDNHESLASTPTPSSNLTLPNTHAHDPRPKTAHDMEAQDERMRYRSWREGKPVYPGRRSTYTPPESHLEDDVYLEKSIAAKLPKAEPAVHPRSRKSSHYLGLFAHQGPTDESRSRGASSRRVVPDQGTEILDREDQTSSQRRIHSATDLSDVTSVSEDLNSSQQIANRPQKGGQSRKFYDSSRETPDPRNIRAKANRGRSLETRHASTSSTQALDYTSKEPSAQKLPQILADEIRHKYNVTPGPGKAHSFSPSIGTTLSERSHPGSTVKRDHKDLLDLHDYFRKESRVYNDRHRDLSSPPEDDEESEREHISSALYFPHRTHGLAESALLNGPSQEDVPSSGSAAIELSTQRVPTGWQKERRPSRLDEVEISLQSQNERHHLHGEFQSARPYADPPAKRIISPPPGAVSVPESDYESVDESVRSQDYESSNLDEQETALTATPEQRARGRGYQENVPRGAVELKPFSHQVGGHSTVYRFSRRAVCKQLNNRENVFYETIERQHPELLDFLPRYDLYYVTLCLVQARFSTHSYAPLFSTDPLNTADTSSFKGTSAFSTLPSARNGKRQNQPKCQANIMKQTRRGKKAQRLVVRLTQMFPIEGPSKLRKTRAAKSRVFLVINSKIPKCHK